MLNKLMLTLATVALGAAWAQSGTGGTNSGQNRPTAANMLERRVERLTALLTLTPSQQTQARAIFTDEATAADALRTPMQEAQAALKTAVDSRLPDPQIEAAAAKVGTAHGQLAAVHAKAQSKLMTMLTEEQRDKLAALRPGDGMRGGPGRGPGGGPMRGMGRGGFAN